MPSTSANFWQPLHPFVAAALQTLGPVLCIAALLAIISFVLRRCFKPHILAALVLLAPVALSMLSMYNHLLLLALPFSLPITIESQQFIAGLGAELVVPAAIFIGTLVGDWSGDWLRA